jgi:hypothetical protein
MDSLNQSEFLPCPFCGDKDQLETCVNDADDPSDCWVQCEGCFSQGPTATIGCRDDEEGDIDLEFEAFELWNERAKPTVDELATYLQSAEVRARVKEAIIANSGVHARDMPECVDAVIAAPLGWSK